ncbi:MAG: hypothetical protein UX72_C0018G0005 [Parcubacteria group bacterium GW2011_GWA2_47_10]|nr:MAG: hypothetical protein UX72_C0018G0005 [Parcubacteria group bacterium GW2011_GWA2_47_10]
MLKSREILDFVPINKIFEILFIEDSRHNYIVSEYKIGTKWVKSNTIAFHSTLQKLNPDWAFSSVVERLFDVE